MSKNKILIIISLIILLIIGIALWYQNKGDGTSKSESKVQITSLVSNKTWETKLQQNVVYKKGDKIEYDIIVRNDDLVSKRINVKQDILDSLGLRDIKIEKASEDVLPGQATIIKISGESMQDGASVDAKNIIILTDGETPKEEKIVTNIDIPQVIFEKNEFVGGVSNLIKVNGTGLQNIKNIGVGDKFFVLLKTKDNQYYIDIPVNNFSSGEYFVFIVGQDGKVKALNKTFKFVGEINKEVSLIDLLPKEIYNDSPRWVVLQGSGFKNTISVQLSNNIIFQNTEFKIISDQVLAVKIPEKLQVGEYYLNIMTLKGIYNLSSTKFNILQKQ